MTITSQIQPFRMTKKLPKNLKIIYKLSNMHRWWNDDFVYRDIVAALWQNLVPSQISTIVIPRWNHRIFETRVFLLDPKCGIQEVFVNKPKIFIFGCFRLNKFKNWMQRKMIDDEMRKNAHFTVAFLGLPFILIKFFNLVLIVLLL